MYSMERCFLRLLFGYLLFRTNFVSAENDSLLKDGKNTIQDLFSCINFENPVEDLAELVKPIKEPSISDSTLVEDASKLSTESIKTAIETTYKQCKSEQPLTFFTPLDETCLVNQTGKSLQITIVDPITVATMALGDDLFEFHHYSFTWKDKPCNETHNLKARVIYRNMKYGTFEEAMDESDGVAMVIFPIATEGHNPNSKFDPLSNLLQTKINRPGDHATIHSAYTYTWFVHFSLDSIFHTYKIPYYDENTAKITNATVIEMPADKQHNFISNEQFREVFGKMGDISGRMSRDYVNLSPVERQKGIVVYYLPA